MSILASIVGIPGVIFAGHMDGRVRAYDTEDGKAQNILLVGDDHRRAGQQRLEGHEPEDFVLGRIDDDIGIGQQFEPIAPGHFDTEAFRNFGMTISFNGIKPENFSGGWG